MGLNFQDGLLRVILDGGPSRVFSTSDSKLLEEDLEVLKVLIILKSFQDMIKFILGMLEF